MTLAYNGTIAFTGSVLTDARIAHEAGYDAIEVAAPRVDAMLAAGISIETLRGALHGLPVCNVGAVLDLERAGADRATVRRETSNVCMTAVQLSAPMIQLCTGPVDRDVVGAHRAGLLPADDSRYRGALGSSAAEAIDAAAAGIADAASAAAAHGLAVCIEPLAWTPVSRLQDAVRAIERSGAANAGLCLDFWHLWAAGDRPEDVASLPRELIRGVQVADGTWFDREIDIADQRRDRDVIVGGGVIPLQEWVDAVKATGYDGWYSAEMFSRRAKQLEPTVLAVAMHALLQVLTA